jgi:hypothetical protein
MNYSVFLTPPFDSCFGARFDADLIDLDNLEDIHNRARGCVASLAAKEGFDAMALRDDLRNFLVTWDRETLLALQDRTNLEWTDSPDMENHLRNIIAALIEQLKT